MIDNRHICTQKLKMGFGFNMKSASCTRAVFDIHIVRATAAAGIQYAEFCSD